MDVFAEKLAAERFDFATMTPSDASMAFGLLTRAVPKGSDDDAELAAAVAHNLRLVPAFLKWGLDDEVSGPFLQASEDQVGLRMIAATAFLIMYFEFVEGGGKHRDEVLGVPLQVVYEVLVKKAPATPTREGSASTSAIDDLLGVAGQYAPEEATTKARSEAGDKIVKSDLWKPAAARAELVDRLIAAARTAGIYINTPVERTEAFEAAVRAVAGPGWKDEFILPAFGPETCWDICEAVLVGEKLMEPTAPEEGDINGDAGCEPALRRACEAFGFPLCFRDVDWEGPEPRYIDEGEGDPSAVDYGDPEASEVIVGDCTGFIRELTDWSIRNVATTGGSVASAVGAIMSTSALTGGNFAIDGPLGLAPPIVLALIFANSGVGKNAVGGVLERVKEAAEANSEFRVESRSGRQRRRFGEISSRLPEGRRRAPARKGRRTAPVQDIAELRQRYLAPGGAEQVQDANLA